MIFATKVGYWAVVPESTWTMFYFNSVSLLVFHQNNACQRTFFCERSEKRFPLSSAREPDWSGVKKEKEKKRKKKSNKKKGGFDSFSSLPPPKLDTDIIQMWRILAVYGRSVDYLYARFVLQTRTPEKPIENFNVIESVGILINRFRIHFTRIKRRKGEGKRRGFVPVTGKNR